MSRGYAPARRHNRSNQSFVDSTHRMRVQEVARAAMKHLTRLWVAIQVSHHGMYSLERTLSLEEYVGTTSTTRALVAVLCTPLPTLVGLITLDAVPLQDPSEGWRANYGAWVRTTFLAMGLAALVGLDVRDLAPGRPVSDRQVILLAVGVTMVYMPMAIAVAALWAFPIPFMITVMTIPYTIASSLMLRWMIGSDGLRRLQTENPGAILRHVRYIHAQGVIIIVYPAFQALFNRVNNTAFELPMMVLVLPWIKISLKLLLARRAAHVGDLIPEIVVVTVELFNAFYLATCIQRIQSPVTTLAVIGVDVAQNVIALRGINIRTTRVWRRHRGANSPNWSGSLLTAVRALIVTPRKLDTQALAGIQLRSCVPHRLSDKASEVLQSLEQGRVCFFAPARVRGTRNLNTGHSDQFPQEKDRAPLSLASVVPTERLDARVARGPTAAAVAPMSRRSTRKSSLLLDSQRMLFTIEYIVLAEYYELMSPFFYSGFIVGLSRLPSAKYHAELEDLAGSALDKTLHGNLLFATLKLASFALLVLTLRRVSGHDALRHIAFVLETRAVPVQMKMLVWAMMVAGFRIVHFGVDFSFRFEWLRGEQAA